MGRSDFIADCKLYAVAADERGFEIHLAIGKPYQITESEWACATGQLPNDTSTAAAVAFYEHLPQKREYWQYFPKWFSRQEVERLMPSTSRTPPRLVRCPP
jgi:hypothetical protein